MLRGRLHFKNNKMKRIRKMAVLSLLLMSILITTACKKDKNPSPDGSSNGNNNTTVPTGTLMLHLHTYIEEQEVDLYGIEYTTVEGRIISLNLAQLYIYDIQLMKLDGSLYSVPGRKILKVFEGESYLVGDVPVGNYKSIRFKVGLDATTNALSPANSPDSIILNKPAMWFGSTAQPEGYVFTNIQGTIDTSATMDQTPVPFGYKIGTNANVVQVNMPDQNYSVLTGQTEYCHIIIDYSKLFTGIQLNQTGNLTVSTPADNSSGIASQIKGNIASMFRYE